MLFSLFQAEELQPGFSKAGRVYISKVNAPISTEIPTVFMGILEWVHAYWELNPMRCACWVVSPALMDIPYFWKLFFLFLMVGNKSSTVCGQARAAPLLHPSHSLRTLKSTYTHALLVPWCYFSQVSLLFLVSAIKNQEKTLKLEGG